MNALSARDISVGWTRDDVLLEHASFDVVCSLRLDQVITKAKRCDIDSGLQRLLSDEHAGIAMNGSLRKCVC